MRIVFITLFLSLALIACNGSHDLAAFKQLGTKEFDEQAWRDADAESRGEMVYRFLKMNQPIKGKSREFILSKLGKSTGYFYAEQDYLFYLDCLKDAARRFRVDVHAYVLTTNRVHLPMIPEGEKRGVAQSVPFSRFVTVCRNVIPGTQSTGRLL